MSPSASTEANHAHNIDHLMILMVTSCVYGDQYKVLVCFDCPPGALEEQLGVAMRADAAWWSPEQTLVLVGAQSPIIGHQFYWSSGDDMRRLSEKLLACAQYDRTVLRIQRIKFSVNDHPRLGFKKDT